MGMPKSKVEPTPNRKFRAPRLTPEQLQAVANALKARRNAANLTMVDLAARAGISMQAIGLIETARSTPSAGTIMALAAALGCKAGDLLVGP